MVMTAPLGPAFDDERPPAERVRRGAEGAGVALESWRGAGGLRRLQERVRVAVPDPAGFEASWSVVALDGARVGAWSTTPVSGARPVSRDPASVHLVLVTEGRLRYWTNGRGVDGGAGSVHLLSTTDPLRFGVPVRTSTVLVALQPVHLGPEARAAVGASFGEVPATRITAGLLALAGQVLDPEAGGPECPAARALRAVAVAVVEDSVPEGAEHDLRARILDHIERRLDDPDLGPQSIAAEFGVSLRWVHQVFNVDGSSLARHIRERRLDLIGERLRDDRRLPRIGALAERSGFGSRDQLTRAFKARYGVTIGEYAALVDLGRPPAPLR